MNEIKWNNLKRIYVFLRYDIENENNDNVINIIINALSNDLNNEEMCRKLFEIMPKWKNQLKMYDKQDKLISCKELELYMIEALKFTKQALYENKFVMAYDLMDILQGLPYANEICKKSNLKRYWKIYIKPFQKKWNIEVFKSLEYIFK